MAEAVIELLKDPKRRAQIGTAALHTIGQHFSLTKSLESYEQLFKQLNPTG